MNKDNAKVRGFNHKRNRILISSIVLIDEHQHVKLRGANQK